MFFVLIFFPKAISFHIWCLKCICIFLLFTKKSRAEVGKFLDFMDSPSNTYMKWCLNMASVDQCQVFPKNLYFARSCRQQRIYFQMGSHDLLGLRTISQFAQHMLKLLRYFGRSKQRREDVGRRGRYYRRSRGPYHNV